MKTLLILLSGVLSLSALAQEKPAKPASGSTDAVQIASPTAVAPSITRRAVEALQTPAGPKPNELESGGTVYSGVIPHMIKTDKPLQLVNPAAPAEYGDGKDNTSFDPATGRPQGLKLFSIAWFGGGKRE